MNPRPVLLDCTLRDGGYHVAWDFSPDLVADYLTAMATVQVDRVEIGFRTLRTGEFMGGHGFSTDGFIRQFDLPEGIGIGVMVNAAELVSNPDGVDDALERLFTDSSESPVSLVRIAAHAGEVERVLPAIAWLKNAGYEVGLNIMQIADREPEEIEGLARLVSTVPPDVLYFADSMGSMDPDQTASVAASIRAGWNGPMGFHAHDNMGRAIANAIRAYEEGVQWIDSTVTGMGRGPGNAQTEHLAIELGSDRIAMSDLAPLLSVVAKHFEPLKARHGWGTNPYYYMAGLYRIHPTFVQTMLSDSRYSDEYRLAAIEHLRQTGGKQFTVQQLEDGRHFYDSTPTGTWKPSDLIEGRQVLILGSGPGSAVHRRALELFVREHQPIVIALNAQPSINEDLIDLRAASHPFRVMSDASAHLNLSPPVATPVSVLPDPVRRLFAQKDVLDFGLGVQPGVLRFDETTCVLPTSLTMAYALGIATSGHATEILMAGFDGFDEGDPRNLEIDQLLAEFMEHEDVPDLQAVTPSRYRLPAGSIYSMT
jgi:4-hydroxy 2-oxovalerate aldolase